MREKSFDTVIALDTVKGEMHFYCRSNDEKKTITYFAAACKEAPLSGAFAARLSAALAKFRESHPEVALQKASIVLSDNNVITDTVNLPLISKRAIDASLDASLSNLYGGKNIKFNRALALQNKQSATYAVAGMRKDLLIRLQESFAKNDVEIGSVTFASAAVAGAAVMQNPKLTNASFVLLDMKNDETKVIFVAGGKALGFYTLPFGAALLNAEALMPEDLLFDHPSAELLVLNANEKAKAKTLTKADTFLSLSINEEEEEDEDAPMGSASDDDGAQTDADDYDEDDTVRAETAPTEKLRKKTPRALPKFMQREIPSEREGILFENFRVFVKWTLELIASNASITALGAPEAVYVNMPHTFDSLYERVNAEAEENGIRFLPLSAETDALIAENLELYGGFFTPQFHKLNVFHASQMDSIKTKLFARAKDPKQPKGGKKKDGEQKTFSEKMGDLWAFIKKIATTEIGGKR